MNDFENELFTLCATDVRKSHPGVTIIGEYVRKPSAFPAVTLCETQNVMVDELMDSSHEERYSGLTYRLQVFSNKQKGKKAEAKTIFATADKVLRSVGLRRKTYTTTPDIYDATIFSITATYEGIIDVNGTIYQR